MRLKSKQLGVTLLETILVLSLVAIIMVGGISLYKNAQNEAKINKQRQEIVAIASAARSLYANASDYSGISSYILSQSEIIPDSIERNMFGNIIYNVYKGKLFVTAGRFLAEDSLTTEHPAIPANQSFWIFGYDLPIEACIKVQTSELGQIGGAWSLDVATTWCNSNPGFSLFFQ